VSDTQLGLSDILGRQTVDVNVLSNVFFADGPVSTLKLSVVPGYGSSATVTVEQPARSVRLAVSARGGTGNESAIVKAAPRGRWSISSPPTPPRRSSGSSPRRRRSHSKR